MLPPLFDRNPDSRGFNFWLNFLAPNGGTTAAGQSNAATRNQVVQVFLNSQEYFDHWVDCAFQVFLGRHVDERAENSFVSLLEHGASEQSVLIDILTSPEFFAHPGRGDHGDQGNQDDQGNQGDHGNQGGHANNGNHTPGAPANSNLAFVDNLFGELLGRGADSASEQALVNGLNSGQLTRPEVVQFFLNSPEEAADLLDAPGSAAGAPGTPAIGGYPLAALTCGGWDNLDFQGRLQSFDSSAVDQFMNELESGEAWQTVQQQMLDLPQYYNAS